MNRKMERWLVVDDDDTFAKTLQRGLARQHKEVLIALDSFDAIKHCNQNLITHAILDLKLGNESGLELLKEMLCIQPAIKVLVLTGYASIATTVNAIKIGAKNYLPKPASLKQILLAFEDNDETIEVNAQLLSPEQIEWEHIQKTLSDNEGNVSATARALNMHRRTLQRKLNKKRL
ncbi:MAG: response regulator [Gammaproteobacteria bacterium]|nr:response regulator [Gammaproteobacteria bacterium]